MGFTELNTAFKEAIGEFTIAFSQMEFALSQLSALSIEDKNEYDLLGSIRGSINNNRENISLCIKNELCELQEVWIDLNQRIGVMNNERKYLIHGFAQYSLPQDKVEVFSSTKNGLIVKQITPQDIKEWTKKISHLTTGVNGVNGEFFIKFKAERINKWNNKLPENEKMVYKVNNEILTEWKG